MSNQDVSNARFTKEAAEWDSNKKHVESTEKAFEAIKKYVPAWDERCKEFNVLELGCGTGLLSYMIAPHVRSLVGVDTAEGMIAAFNDKLAALPDGPHPNLCAINHLLTSADSPALQGAAAALATQRGEKSQPPYKFDLIISHLTLHHIPSMPEIFKTLHACLRHGGMIALTDYEDYGDEAIKFHPEEKRPGVERHGIRVKEAEEILVDTGFNEVVVEKAYVLRKEVAAEDGKPAAEIDFPFLMLYGVKSWDA